MDNFASFCNRFYTAKIRVIIIIFLTEHNEPKHGFKPLPNYLHSLSAFYNYCLISREKKIQKKRVKKSDVIAQSITVSLCSIRSHYLSCLLLDPSDS